MWLFLISVLLQYDHFQPLRRPATEIRSSEADENALPETDARLDAKTIRQGIEFCRQRVPGPIPEHRFAPPLPFCPSSGNRKNHSETTLRGSALSRKRTHLAPRERPLAGLLLARDDRGGLRLSRLRQRRLDGHLSGEQRQVRFVHTGSATAQCALPQQSGWHVYRRD